MAKGAKERWLKNNYASVKVSIRQDIVHAFRKACNERQQSQESILKNAMIDYVDMEIPHNDKGFETNNKNDKRGKRRKNVADIISELEQVLNAEEIYCDGIPDNFVNRKGESEEAIEKLTEAINILSEIY